MRDADLVRTLLETADPSTETIEMLAIFYLAGRASIIGELFDGFEKAELPAVVLARAAEDDTELAKRFGLDPAWQAGRSSQDAAKDGMPTLADAERFLSEFASRRQAGGDPV